MLQRGIGVEGNFVTTKVRLPASAPATRRTLLNPFPVLIRVPGPTRIRIFQHQLAALHDPECKKKQVLGKGMGAAEKRLVGEAKIN